MKGNNPSPRKQSFTGMEVLLCHPIKAIPHTSLEHECVSLVDCTTHRYVALGNTISSMGQTGDTLTLSDPISRFHNHRKEDKSQ